MSESTKLSIVVPVLDSHVIVRRLIIYYKRLQLPDDIEIIFMDDNSNPPLKEKINMRGLKNCYIYPTGDTRLWTIACARNLGIKIAQGKYILNIDVDHFPSKEAIQAAYNFKGDKLRFHRVYGIINNKGYIKTDKKTLLKYGMNEVHWNKRRNRRYSHIMVNCMPKDLIIKIGGYPKHTCDYGAHPTREDQIFHFKYLKHANAGHCSLPVMSKKIEKIYCFPEACQKKYFHKLTKKTRSRYIDDLKNV